MNKPSLINGFPKYFLNDCVNCNKLTLDLSFLEVVAWQYFR